MKKYVLILLGSLLFLSCCEEEKTIDISGVYSVSITANEVGYITTINDFSPHIDYFVFQQKDNSNFFLSTYYTFGGMGYSPLSMVKYEGNRIRGSFYTYDHINKQWYEGSLDLSVNNGKLVGTFIAVTLVRTGSIAIPNAPKTIKGNILLQKEDVYSIPNIPVK
jgi:hypothetical protein